jgi:Transglutaminase-like superfamily
MSTVDSHSPRPGAPSILQVIWASEKLVSMLLIVTFRRFPGLYLFVRTKKTRHVSAIPNTTKIGTLALAMQIASVWLPLRTYCLTYSAALVCFLRDHGVPAELVIGIRQRPFQGHAWIEYDGLVIGDSTDRRNYTVLDRL